MSNTLTIRQALSALLAEAEMSTECRYDRSTTDPRCGACKHRHTAEQYDKMIREKGK